MSFMETNKEITMKKFSAKDICSIIETCSNAGVSKLDLGPDIKIEFSSGFLVPDPSAILPADSPEPVVEEILLSPQDKELLEGIEETQAMIDDPDRYETMIRDSYLAISETVNG